MTDRSEDLIEFLTAPGAEPRRPALSPVLDELPRPPDLTPWKEANAARDAAWRRRFFIRAVPTLLLAAVGAGLLPWMVGPISLWPLLAGAVGGLLVGAWILRAEPGYGLAMTLCTLVVVGADALAWRLGSDPVLRPFGLTMLGVQVVLTQVLSWTLVDLGAWCRNEH